MELEMTIGGITYKVEVDIEDEYVSDVLGVEVLGGKSFMALDLNPSKLEEFYSTYVDQLNEAYQDHKIALAESAAEEKWERENDR